MRWILILLVVVAGCRRKPTPPTEPPPPPANTAPAAATAAPANRPAAATAPNPRPSRAGHPGEPANPESLHGLPEKYFNQVGSFPNSWQQMIERKYISAVPMGKNGKPLDFRQYAEWTTLRP